MAQNCRNESSGSHEMDTPSRICLLVGSVHTVKTAASSQISKNWEILRSVETVVFRVFPLILTFFNYNHLDFIFRT